MFVEQQRIPMLPFTFWIGYVSIILPKVSSEHEALSHHFEAVLQPTYMRIDGWLNTAICHVSSIMSLLLPYSVPTADNPRLQTQ